MKGKVLWDSVQTVITLRQVMRQAGPENAPFVEMLARLREGKCTDQDYSLL